MKKSFFALLLINSIYFIWHMSSSRSLDQSGDEYTIAKQGNETIFLVKELPASREVGRRSAPYSKRTSGDSRNSDGHPDSIKTGFDVALLKARKTGQSRTKKDRAGTIKSQQLARSEKDSIGTDLNRSSQPDRKTPTALARSAALMGEGGTKEDRVEPSAPGSSKKIDHRLASVTPFLGRKTAPECYRLGPFSAKEPVERLTVDLAGIASWFRVVSDPTDVQTGFWVLFPPGDDLEASRANYEILKARGIEEIWLFTNGELRGFISLGLFIFESEAVKALAGFKEMGIYGAEMRPWTVKEYKHWLLFVTGEAHGTVMKRVRISTDSRDEIELTTMDSCQQLVRY